MVFEYGHLLYLNIDVLKTYFSRFLTRNAEQLFRKAPFDCCFWQYIGGKIIVRKILTPSGKPVYGPIYSLFEMPINENYPENCKVGCYGGRVLQQTFRWGLC